MTATVRIYSLVRGTDCWFWLCARCLRDMQAEGWALKDSKDPPHELLCDGKQCKAARSTAKAAA